MATRLTESIVGDLEEERHRRAVRSRVLARLWFWHAAASIAIAFGLAKVTTSMRDAFRSVFLIRGLRAEVRQAARALRHSPWYAVTIIAVVALSMALATTTFAIVDGVLFKPLPYRAPEEVFIAGGSWLNSPYKLQRVSVSAKDYRDWSAANPELRLAAIGQPPIGGRVGDFPARSLVAASVTQNFFDLIGLHPIVGGFSDADYQAIAPDGPVLVSYSVWQSVFSGRTDIVGQSLTFSTGRTVRVVGILPADFVFPSDLSGQPDLLSPAVLTPQDFENRARRQYTLVVRVPRPTTVAQAQQKLEATAQSLMDDFPANTGQANGAFDHVNLRAAVDVLTTTSRPTFLVVFAASGSLVLLACLSLAGLAGARAEDRAREVALRRALGASGWTIVRTQFLETWLLALAGTAIGVVLTPVLANLTLRMLPESMSLLKPPDLDWRVLAFAVGSMFAMSSLVALWPAAIAARLRLSPILASASGSTRRARAVGRRVLVAAQVAVGLVLTIGGTLVVSSLLFLWSEDPGYPIRDAVVIEASTPGDMAARRVAAGELVDRLRRVPGVRLAATFDGPFLRNSIRADIPWKTPADATGGCLSGSISGVSGDFFAALDMTPIQGRLPTADEIEQGAPLAVMSETAVHACWPAGVSPLGRVLEIANRSFAVVGVVRGVRYRSFDAASRGETYVSRQVLPLYSSVFIARTKSSAGSMIPTVLAALKDAGVLGRTTRLMTMSDVLANNIRPRRLNAWLFGAFAVASLLVVGVGILGLMAMTTARRTREIGIRYALGGRRPSVIGLLLREQSASVIAGVMAGGAVAAWAVKFAKAYLYAFAPTDIRLWAIAVATVSITALVGGLIPAVRVSRVDPVVALRET